MTRRQNKIGVTSYGIQMLKQYGCISCIEAFIAALSTHKKGQFRGLDICKELFPTLDEELAILKFDDVKCLLNAATIIAPDFFHYTNTLGLDTLTIR